MEKIGDYIISAGGKRLRPLLVLATAESCTGGLVGLGYLYDLWTLNDQISLINVTER